MSETVATSPPPPLPAQDPNAGPVASGDFPGWMSPMVVKELRQGLRTKLFVSFFIIVQVVMFGSLLLSAMVPGGEEGVSFLIWAVIGISLLVVAPMRALGSVSSEVGSNTLDLLLLTTQGPLKVVFGKWSALFAQVLLAVVSILPYLVARYFLGGTNVFEQLATLFHLVIASAVLCAAGVAISATAGAIVRWLLGIFAVVGAAISAYSYIIFTAMSGGMGGPGGSGSFFGIGFGNGAIGFAAETAMAAVAVWLFLEIAAGRISPPAADRAWVRRVIALLAGVACAAVGAIDNSIYIAFVFAAFIFPALGIVDALTGGAPPKGVAWGKRWYGGGIGSFFLAPGWHTGALYALFVCIATVLASAAFISNIDAIAAILCICSQLVLPAFIVRLFKSDHHAESFQLYIGAQIALAIVSSILLGFSEIPGGDWLRPAMSFFPLVAISHSAYGSEELVILLQTAVFLLSVFGLVFIGRRLLGGGHEVIPDRPVTGTTDPGEGGATPPSNA